MFEGMAAEIDALERLLLRKGVGELTAHRDCCADCHRTPLIGERIYLYDKGKIVCELCRPLRRQEPARSETVRHSEHGQTVRLTVRAA